MGFLWLLKDGKSCVLIISGWGQTSKQIFENAFHPFIHITHTESLLQAWCGARHWEDKLIKVW